MLKIYNIKDRPEYLREVITLTQKEWGKTELTQEELENKINQKIERIRELFNHPCYCKLILLEDNILVGFISIFPTDGEERQDLSPWYATMYVKEKYRGKGYSKILNNAILEEARNRKIKRIYLKTELTNYYERFGAEFMDNLKNGEKLYYIDL